MSGRQQGKRQETAGKAPGAYTLLGGAVVVAAIWLGWQIIQVPLLDRAPPSFAVRLSPGSPETLRRAAEQELTAGRNDNAAALAADSLSRAPFNARALRVLGLAESRAGDDDLADQLLTISGNWSLRDDPSHAWLTEYRLRRGDYASAFAHADTLARRRIDLYPHLFNLFTTAAASDRRAIPPLIRLIGANPSWRAAYIPSLYERDDGDAVLFALAVGLEETPKPFDAAELGRLYETWRYERRIPALRQLRGLLNRPPAALSLVDGDFSATEAPLPPFGWELGSAPGIAVEITRDDIEPDNSALRAQTSGQDKAMLVQQLVLLDPGAHTLDGRWRMESAATDRRPKWTVTCFESGEPIAVAIRPVDGATADSAWRPFSASFTVPVQNCTAQWLRLEQGAADRPQDVAIWFDNLNFDRDGER